jgi:hypothetical protein
MKVWVYVALLVLLAGLLRNPFVTYSIAWGIVRNTLNYTILIIKQDFMRMDVLYFMSAFASSTLYGILLVKVYLSSGDLHRGLTWPFKSRSINLYILESNRFS